MSNINISGLKPVDDPSYRYKMPKLIPKLEGRGNGSKTCLVNCKEIAQALHRSPDELCKFFGVELGTQSTYGQDERAILNGHHTYDILYTALTKYIEVFVICPHCRQPEVPKYKIKGDDIHLKCVGCGNNSIIPPMHKLCTFILRKHRNIKKQTKKEKKKRKHSKTSQKKKSSKIKEKKKERKEVVSTSVEFKLDTAPEKELTLDCKDIEDSTRIDCSKVMEYIKEFVESFLNPLPITDAHTMLDIIDTQIISNIFDDNIDLQLEVIGLCEMHCIVHFPDSKCKFPILLNKLYEKDILEEDVIIRWFEEPEIQKYLDLDISEDDRLDLRQIASPMYRWLKEAESESESD